VVDIGDHLTTFDDADRVIFFADDNDKRVCFFSETDRGPVARSQVFIKRGVFGEWQKTAGRPDPSSAHNDRAIVKRPRWQKNRIHQLGTHDRVDLGADLDEILEIDFFLENHQCAHPFLRELNRTARDFFDDVSFLNVRGPRKKRIASDMRQGSTNFSLKENDDDKKEVVEKLLEDPVEREEFKPNTHQVGDGEDAETREHLHRAGMANQNQHAVDDDPHQDHVDQVASPQLRENELQIVVDVHQHGRRQFAFYYDPLQAVSIDDGERPRKKSEKNEKKGRVFTQPSFPETHSLKVVQLCLGRIMP
jgi:hypothetical protein